MLEENFYKAFKQINSFILHVSKSSQSALAAILILTTAQNFKVTQGYYGKKRWTCCSSISVSLQARPNKVTISDLHNIILVARSAVLLRIK